ncbi:hypothetical protein Tco_0079669 [Tanacetum coccineum]
MNVYSGKIARPRHGSNVNNLKNVLGNFDQIWLLRNILKILKETLHKPKTFSSQMSRGRKCVSISAFDSSDFSAAEDPSVNSLTTTPIRGATSSGPNCCICQQSPNGVFDDTCDVPSYDNSPPLDVLKDHFKIFSDSNNDCTSSDNDSFENIDYVKASLLEDSLIMGNEELSTIPEKESNEFIKSSVEDLVPILSESEDTSGSDSESVLPSCDDFSPIFEEKSVTFSNPLFNSNDDFSVDESLSDKDILEDVKIYSNPLFEFDDEYISSERKSSF